MKPVLEAKPRRKSRKKLLSENTQRKHGNRKTESASSSGLPIFLSGSASYRNPPELIQRQIGQNVGAQEAATAIKNGIAAGLSAVAGVLPEELISDPALFQQQYEWHLQTAILLLEAAAGRAAASGSTLFGRTTSGDCLSYEVEMPGFFPFPPFSQKIWVPKVTHAAFDARFWSFKVDCEAGKADLEQIEGKPSEAIDEMFENLHRWTFDCAEYLQVAKWYAQRHTLGAEAFNARIKGLGRLTLRNHGSTGIITADKYVRKGPWDPFYRWNYITYQTQPSDETEGDLLDAAPIGTRVTWSNTAAPAESSGKWWIFGHENAIKIGEDRYAAHPFGTVSRAELECRMAAWGHVKELEEDKKGSAYSRHILRLKLNKECKSGRPRELISNYIHNKIYVSYIEFFKKL